MNDRTKITGRLVAAARALTGISQMDLANVTGITVVAIDRMEASGGAWLTESAEDVDPPSLKWSDLKYVFWHQGGPICRGGDTRLKRSSPS